MAAAAICSAIMCALYTIWLCSRVLNSYGLKQRDGPLMLKVRLDTFRVLPRISRLVKKSHDTCSKPFMAWLRDACYIVVPEDTKEASEFVVTCAGVRIESVIRRDFFSCRRKQCLYWLMYRDQYAHVDLASNCRYKVLFKSKQWHRNTWQSK